MRISGSCHCRNITFELAWPGEPERIPARACGCTFCVKHGGLWTSHPEGSLQVRIARPREVSRYEFGTRTAVFHVCAACGVAPVVTCEIEGRRYAVVSVNAFEGIGRERLDATPISYDGEDTASRLDRRQRRWIPDVSISEGP